MIQPTLCNEFMLKKNIFFTYLLTYAFIRMLVTKCIENFTFLPAPKRKKNKELIFKIYFFFLKDNNRNKHTQNVY